MNLSYRPAGPSEVAACIDLLPAVLSLDPNDINDITAFYRLWRSQGRIKLTVVESAGDLGPPAIVAFGTSAFVSDEFAHSVVIDTHPPLIKHVVRCALEGRDPILDPIEVRHANSTTGLNLMIPAIGWREDIDDPAVLSRIKAKLVEAFYYTHAGYNIKDTFQEVHGEQEMRRGLAAGAALRTDYGYAYDHGRAPDPSARPYLMGASRDEVVEGSYLYPLYLFNPPQIFFTPAEQSVLELAVLDMTDSQIASALSLGDATIKKRWRSIIARASAARHINWLPTEHGAPRPAGKASTRGVEKRRYIISYMRAHPEELRPYAPPKK